MGGGLVCACRKRRPESVNAGLSHTVRQAAAVRPRPGLRPGRPHLGNNLVRHSALERGFPPLGSGPGYIYPGPLLGFPCWADRVPAATVRARLVIVRHATDRGERRFRHHHHGQGAG